MNAIIREIGKYPDAFNFRKDDLYLEVAEVAADAILAMMDAECDADGNRWPELSARYAAWKAARFPGQPMGVLRDVMKQSLQLQGELIVSPDLMYQTYGSGSEEARAHAEWFQDPHNPNQPPRPFYALGAAALKALDALFDDVFGAAIR